MHCLVMQEDPARQVSHLHLDSDCRAPCNANRRVIVPSAHCGTVPSSIQTVDRKSESTIARIMGSLTLRDDFSTFLRSARDIDLAIESVEHYLLALKEYKNTRCPVLWMPDDILVRIFKLVVDDHDLYATAEYRSPTDRPHRWLYITHVCKRWRQAALDYPVLWTRIIVGRATLRGQTFIARAGECELTVEANEYKWDSSDATVTEALLSDYAHRLKNLRGFLITPKLICRARSHQALDLPLLESLGVLYRNTYGSDILPRDYMLDDLPVDNDGRQAASSNPFHFPPLSDAPMPRIRRIFSDNLPWRLLQSFVRPSLTHLHVARMHYQLPSVKDWLRSLRDLPHLEHLELNNAIRPLQLSAIRDGAHLSEPVVSLPKLKQALFSQPFGCPAGAALLLFHIDSPPRTRISITPGEMDYSPDPELNSHVQLRVRFVTSCLAGRMSRILNNPQYNSTIQQPLYRTAVFAMEMGEDEDAETSITPLCKVTFYDDYSRTRPEKEGSLVIAFVPGYGQMASEHGEELLRDVFDSELFLGLQSLLVMPVDLEILYDPDQHPLFDDLRIWTHLAESRVGRHLLHLGMEDAPSVLPTVAKALLCLRNDTDPTPSFEQLETFAILPSRATSEIFTDRDQYIVAELALRDALAERRRRGLGPSRVDIGNGLVAIDEFLSSAPVVRETGDNECRTW